MKIPVKIINYLCDKAEVAKRVLQLGDDETFALYGGTVRDCLLAHEFGTKVPKITDIDVVLNRKLKEKDLNKNKNIDLWMYNAFGGHKVTSRNINIDICSCVLAKNFDEFAAGMNFNCNCVFFVYPQKKLIITKDFEDFLQTKCIRKSSNKLVLKSGPFSTAFDILLVSMKLSDRFGMRIDISDTIKKSLRNENRVVKERIAEYLNNKIRYADFAKRLLQTYNLIVGGE